MRALPRSFRVVSAWVYGFVVCGLVTSAAGTASAQGGGIGSTNFGNIALDFVEGGTDRAWNYESGQDWWTLRTLPGVTGIGGDIAGRFNGCTYGLLGNGTPIFYRYSGSCGSGNVQRLADAPFIPGRGAKLSALGGAVSVALWDHVYALRGGDTRELWRYSISTNSWTRLPDVPEPVGDAGSLDVVFAANTPSVNASFQLGVFTRSGSTTMHLFDLETQVWTALPLPFTLQPGASLVSAIGARIDVMPGGREYWQFETYSGWSRKADAPGEISIGADMSYIGAGINNDTFVYPGDGSTEAWAFGFFDNTWRVFVRIPQNNTPPVANAGPDVTLEGCGACIVGVTLNSAGTFDPDGHQMRMVWREGTRVLSTFNATVTGAGDHVITLTVTDSRGGVSTDSFTVTVIDPKIALLQQIAALQGSLATLQAALDAATQTIASLEQQVFTLQGSLSGANATIASLQSSLAQCQASGGTAVAQMAASLGSIEADLAAAFGQSDFVLPGGTPQDQLAALAQAIASMNRGSKQQLYRQLGGKK